VSNVTVVRQQAVTAVLCIRNVPEETQMNRAATQVNMADVARAAGVSTSTVSRALRGEPGVSAGTRERISSIAARLSYVVSPDASALARRSTNRVGVVLPNIGSWFYSTMLTGIEGLLRAADLDTLIYHVDGSGDRERFFDRLPARRKVDAAIVVALPVTEQQAERLELMGVHVVVAGGRLGSYPHVKVDDVEVGRCAVEHLVRLGHERIAMIRSHDGEGVSWPADVDRAAGFRLGLEQAGLEIHEELVVAEQWGVQGGREGMRRLLARGPRPTAVLAFSDEMALGALHFLRVAGIAVPDEMSVIGVDDHPMSELHDLTTIRQSVQEQVAAAARITLDLLDGRVPKDCGVSAPTELVVRATTGRVTTGATTR
jgi:LacI family transcriptional regulator, repressor for deo operon, udp, cdd, tsx, nupC, and nupG